MGYGKRQDEGRDLEGWAKNGVIEAKLKISRKNAKSCIKNIWILPASDKSGEMVYFKRPSDNP
jgi:hypothetical protein